MRVAIFSLAVVALLVIAAVGTGLVGFHYPKVVVDEPLQNPQKVTRIDGTNIFLQDGRVIAIGSADSLEISNRLSQSSFQIDLERTKGETAVIWARQNGWICGTSWAQPIRIPVIRDTVYKNRRQLIATGSYGATSQPDDAANRSQPSRSETNSTPSAAGSRR
jgi:hypothetical protein